MSTITLRDKNGILKMVLNLSTLDSILKQNKNKNFLKKLTKSFDNEPNIICLSFVDDVSFKTNLGKIYIWTGDYLQLPKKLSKVRKSSILNLFENTISNRIKLLDNITS